MRLRNVLLDACSQGIHATAREDSRWLSHPRKASPWLSDLLSWFALSSPELLVCEHGLSAKVCRSFAKKVGVFFQKHLGEAVLHFTSAFELELSQWESSGSSQLLTSHAELHHNMVLLSRNPPPSTCLVTAWLPKSRFRGTYTVHHLTSPLPADPHFWVMKHHCSATASALQIDTGSRHFASY